MDEESYAVIQEILRDDVESQRINYFPAAVNDDDREWKTVSYQRRRRKQPAKPSLEDAEFGSGDVFRPIEQQAAERRRRIEAQAKVIYDEDAVDDSNYGVKSDGDEEAEEGGDVEEVEKPKKAKKEKKPKVTVAEAAAKINGSDLAVFLADITESYKKQEDILLMRFADYFGRAFGAVSASQFPWVKILKESSVAKMTDVPLSHISREVYKTSTEWLNQRSFEALGSFVLWLWDNILADFDIHQGFAKVTKKVVQQAPSKSQVAIFVVLAMTLRQKPEVLASLMPILRESSKYQGQDKLPVTVWVIAQICQGDLAMALLMWAQFLLPMLSSRSSCNPQSRDLILQLVERTLASPKADRVLLNGAVRKGERLVPSTALELLMRATFPASSSRVKATDRFEAVYPTLKEIALAGSPGSKAMKPITQQILQFAIKAAGEGVPDLSNEATNLAISCLTLHPDCYKQWDELYLDNLEACVLVLRKLVNGWKEYSVKLSTLEPLNATLTSFGKKNEKAIATEEDVARVALFKDAEKLRKFLMARLSRSHPCMKGTLFVSVALAIGATAAVVMSQSTDSWDLKKLMVDFI